MNKIRKHLLHCLLIAPAAAAAQSGDNQDQVVVYGTRLLQPATEVGSSVTIITADDMEAQGFDFVLDAIAAAPGVTINQNGSFGGSASIRVRGASSEQTLVIIDGLVVNDPTSPGGGFDFSRLDVANVERIEVLRGPQSTLWGTDAIGGVINIVLKRPGRGFGGNAFAQAGSFGAFRGGAEVSQATDLYALRVALTTNTLDGISKADESNGNTEVDSYDGFTVSASAGLNLSADARLQLSVLRTEADAEFDSFMFGAQGNVGDGNELSQSEELSANLSLQLPLFNGRLQNTMLVGIADIDRESFSNGMSGFQSSGERTTYRYQGNLSLGERNRIAFGAEREESESNSETAAIDGLFAFYELQAFDSLTLTAGLRRDDHDKFGGETTGRLAAAFNPNDRLTVRASWGEGFKAPTLFQTTFFCCGALLPNANLMPEASSAYDIGVTIRTSDARGELGLTYFEQDTSNLITFSFATGGYENIAIAESSGVEIVGSYRITDWARISASYANIDAVDQDGTRLPRVPQHSGDVALTLGSDGPLTGSILLRHNGSEEDPGGDVESWTRVDIASRYRLSEKLELYARLENLFDADYQQILGYGTPGLSGNLGVQLKF